MNSISFNLFRLKRKIITFNIKNSILKKDVEKYLAYNYLYKNYKNIIEESNYKNTKQELKKIVWFCWFQGIENAPKLVQTCFNKIKKVFKDYEVVLITTDNYKEYVEIPEYIINKWKNGIISNTHFSDIIRIELLAKHGGIWIDSTVYPTCNKVPNYILEDGMFLYKDVNLNRNDKSIIVASSWFLKTSKNDPIILLTRDLLREYWKNNNAIIDYFLLHLFFSMSTKKYIDYWESISNYNNVNPHIMQFELHKKYDKERFEYFKSLSDFHKLSYKFDFTKFEKNSNYDYIVGDINE